MDRRDFLKTTAVAAAYIPFSPAPRPVVDHVVQTKYDDYEVVDWLQCRLVLFDHRNRPIHCPKIAAVHIGGADFPVLLQAFYRVTKAIKISAMQFIDKDGKVPFKPVPLKLCLINNDTFHCKYRMERP